MTAARQASDQLTRPLKCDLRAAARKARRIQLYGKRTKPVHRW